MSAGSNYIQVFGKEPNLFHDNEMKLIDNTPGIVSISPFKQKTAEVTYYSTSKHIGVIGVTERKELGKLEMIKEVVYTLNGMGLLALFEFGFY